MLFAIYYLIQDFICITFAQLMTHFSFSLFTITFHNTINFYQSHPYD